MFIIVKNPSLNTLFKSQILGTLYNICTTFPKKMRIHARKTPSSFIAMVLIVEKT